MPAFDQIPLPPAVARRPRVGRLPVPAVTLFEPDDGTDPAVRRHTDNGPVLDCRCSATNGRPLLGTLCPRRQRALMINRRCNICAEPISGRALFTLQLLRLDSPEPEIAAYEPPLHPECLAVSALLCPHLINTSDVPVAMVEGTYTLWDQWRLPDHTTTHRPHRTTRRLLPNEWATLELVAAQLNGPDTNLITLSTYMIGDAPEPYRTQWVRDQMHRRR